MKKLLHCVLLVLMATFTASADFYVKNADGVTIHYNKTSSTEVEVICLSSGEYSGKVNIPSEVMHNGITYSVTSIGEGAFCECGDLTAVTIPNSVTSIGKEAFLLCSGLTEVIIPDSVTTIHSNAFDGCSSLTSIAFGNSVTTIHRNSFNGCSSLTSITIPDSVTAIGNSAFTGCNAMTTLVIGKSVTSIGRQAFDCLALTSVICKVENPKNISVWVSETFDEDVLLYSTLYVPKGTKELYEFEWGEFMNIKEIGSVEGSGEEPGEDPGEEPGYGDKTPGDVNADGSINVSDVTSIVDYILDPASSSVSFYHADVNGDGAVNVSDVSGIVDKMIKGDPNYTISTEPEALFLIGGASGWLSPSASNFSSLSDWRLFRVSAGVYVGTFYIPSGQANFRFYSALNGWDENSIGIGYGNYIDDSCGFNEYGIFSSGLVYGKGSIGFSGWSGGYVTISVDLNNMYVVILKLDSAPDPMYLTAEGDYVSTKLYYTSNNTFIGQNYYGIGEASFKIGNLGVAQTDCVFPADENDTFTATLVENGNPIRFSKWPGGVLEIKANLNSRTVEIRPMAVSNSVVFESVTTNEVIHVAKGDNTLIPLANVKVKNNLRVGVSYDITVSNGTSSRKVQGVYEDGKLSVVSNDINSVVRELCGFTSAPVTLNLTISAKTSYYDIKLSDDFAMTVNMISDDTVSFLYTPGAGNYWIDERSNVLFSEDGVNYSGFAFIDQSFWIKDKENSIYYGDRWGNLDCSTDAQPIEVYSKGLYFVDANLSWGSYDLTYIDSIGVIGDFCGWSQAVNFTRSSNSLVWEGDVTFSEGGKFVIQCNNSWDMGMFGGSADCVVRNGGNLTTPGSGTYHVKFDISKYPYTLTYTKK